MLSIPTKDHNAQNFFKYIRQEHYWVIKYETDIHPWNLHKTGIFWNAFLPNVDNFHTYLWVPVRGRDPKCFHQVSTWGHKEVIDDTPNIAVGGVVLKCFGSLPIILYWIMQCWGEFLFGLTLGLHRFDTFLRFEQGYIFFHWFINVSPTTLSRYRKFFPSFPPNFPHASLKYPSKYHSSIHFYSVLSF